MEYCDVITKDILIIQCPFNKRAGIGNVFPLGIGYLMKALEENGNSFDFYDCAYITEKVDDCSITEVLQKLSLFLERQTYKIISISGVTTGAILSLRSIVNVCRKCAPMSKLIIGGPLPSIKETVKVFFCELFNRWNYAWRWRRCITSIYIAHKEWKFSGIILWNYYRK